MINKGASYYDHYVEHFGEIVATNRFDMGVDGNLQILEFPYAFKECFTYASLGYSDAFSVTQKPTEIVVVANDAFAIHPQVMTDVINKGLHDELSVDDGAVFDGVFELKVDPTTKHNKTAMFFVDASNIQLGLGHVGISESTFGDVVLGVYITDGELKYIRENTANDFMNLLFAVNVDAFDVRRNTLV